MQSANPSRKARSVAGAHRAEIGEVLAEYADRPNPLFLVAAWLAFSGLTLINPGETAVLAVAPTVAFGIIFALMYVYLSGERLLVCERGLVVGSVAPGLRPYVVRYEQIAPGTLVPVTGAQRHGAETGTRGLPESTLRRSLWTRRGIHFVGPSPQEARRHRAALARLQDPPPRSVDHRWVWFVGSGSTPPEQVCAQIARAAGTGGWARLAEATAAAPVRQLSGNPEDAARHLPGLASGPTGRG